MTIFFFFWRVFEGVSFCDERVDDGFFFLTRVFLFLDEGVFCIFFLTRVFFYEFFFFWFCFLTIVVFLIKRVFLSVTKVFSFFSDRVFFF